MIRSTLVLAIAALGFNAMDASAAEVQVAYKGIITQANGVQASAFLPGQEILIRYVVDTSAVDTNPNPSAGVYYNTGLKQLHISIADADVNVSTGIGTVQTFNDVSGTDQAFFYSHITNGLLASMPVIHAEIDFVDEESSMLSNDGIPTTHLPANDTFVSLGTNAGFTSLRLLLEPAALAPTCAEEGFTGTKLAWCKNICENGNTGAAREMWIRRWVNRYHELPACALIDVQQPE
ncbi:MAG: hypothetical protein E6Q81_02080 [Thermomonas sp.]|nr:MAG: hypothetical protein E6Q81_02080 [Thermomonas sp.]